MRHAVLATGGVCGLLAAALARAQRNVVLLMRPQTLARYDGRLEVESAVLGSFIVEVPAAAKLEQQVDALWIAVKAMQLEAALQLATRNRVLGEASVVPLLNGVDHVGFRTRYNERRSRRDQGRTERLSSWRIRQTSPFLRIAR